MNTGVSCARSSNHRPSGRATGGSESKQFFGKYRGVVVNNIDPRKLGRIQAIVPDVSAIALSSWAVPCVPVAGMQTGLFSVPPPGSGVWIEFEQGDPDYPIWSGCYWGETVEFPTLAQVVPPGVPGIVLQTPLQNGIVISDAPGPLGGIQLKTATGALIAINDLGITISNGKGATLTLLGNVVDINNTALTIT
jgi:hypothetical protein